LCRLSQEPTVQGGEVPPRESVYGGDCVCGVLFLWVGCLRAVRCQWGARGSGRWGAAERPGGPCREATWLCGPVWEPAVQDGGVPQNVLGARVGRRPGLSCFFLDLSSFVSPPSLFRCRSHFSSSSRGPLPPTLRTGRGQDRGPSLRRYAQGGDKIVTRPSW
jgi:hypothetical protein